METGVSFGWRVPCASPRQSVAEVGRGGSGARGAFGPEALVEGGQEKAPGVAVTQDLGGHRRFEGVETQEGSAKTRTSRMLGVVRRGFTERDVARSLLRGCGQGAFFFNRVLGPQGS